MIPMIYRLITILIAIGATLSSYAQLSQAENRNLTASLKRDLSAARTPADSITILYNIFDLSMRDEQCGVLESIYAAGGRAGKQEVQLDALRRMAAIVPEDSRLAELQKRAMKFADSADRKETVTFIRLMRITRDALRLSDRERVRKLEEFMASHMSRNNKEEDPYEQMLDNYFICVFLAGTSEGDLVIPYLEKVGQITEKLPHGANSLRNAYYVNAARIYEQSGNAEKAIAINRKLFSVLKEMKDRYVKQGRIYRNYDSDYYLAYRRLLSNYSKLPLAEVNHIYDEIRKIAERNSDVRQDMEENKRVEAYYLMANKRYPEAVVALKSSIANANNAWLRLRLTRMLRDAAEGAGDRASAYQAGKDYAHMLEEHIEAKSLERLSEYQILYDVADLREANAHLQIENQQARIDNSQRITVGAVLACAILILLSMSLYGHWRKSRSLSEKLAASNESLRRQRDELDDARRRLEKACADLETHSIDRESFAANSRHGSHDITAPMSVLAGVTETIAKRFHDDDIRDSKRFSEAITRGSERLQNLVRNSISLTTLSHGALELHAEDTSLDAICRAALRRARHKLGDNVIMRYNPDSVEDVRLCTDKQRAVEILDCLLDNAVKFTIDGFVTLSYGVDKERGMAEFLVADTGIGMSLESQSLVFRRFVQFNFYTSGAGLGLPLARELARAMGGDVEFVNTSGVGTVVKVTLPLISEQK